MLASGTVTILSAYLDKATNLMDFVKAKNLTLHNDGEWIEPLTDYYLSIPMVERTLYEKALESGLSITSIGARDWFAVCSHDFRQVKDFKEQYSNSTTGIRKLTGAPLVSITLDAQLAYDDEITAIKTLSGAKIARISRIQLVENKL